MEKLLPVFELQLEQLRPQLEQATSQKDITYHLNLILERSIQAYKQNLTIPQIRVITPVLDILQGGVTSLASLRVLGSASHITQRSRPELRIGGFNQTQIELAGTVLVVLLLFSAMSASWLVSIALVLVVGLVALRLSRWFVSGDISLGQRNRSEAKIDINALLSTLRENVAVYDRASEALIATVTSDAEQEPIINASSKRLDPDILEFLQQLLGMQRLGIQPLQNDSSPQNCTDEAHLLLQRFGVRELWYDEQLSENEKAMFEQIIDPGTTSVICMLPAIINEEESLLEGRILVPQA